MRRIDTTFPSVLPSLIANELRAWPEVTAVAMAGSREAGTMDDRSDIDLYVYLTAPVSLAARAALADRFATAYEVGNETWEPGDEWVHTLTGTPVDLMFRTPAWIEQRLARVLQRHEASVGYSTCLWHNVLHSDVLYDRTGWFGRLQAMANVPYPEPLRRAIIAKNHPILRRTLSSYLRQIELALWRDDQVSVQHRVTALLASYFDVMFAFNRVPHPGEKRQLRAARDHCAHLPVEFERRVRDVLTAGVTPGVTGRLDQLLDGLDELLAAGDEPRPAAPELVAVATDFPWREWSLDRASPSELSPM